MQRWSALAWWLAMLAATSVTPESRTALSVPRAHSSSEHFPAYHVVAAVTMTLPDVHFHPNAQGVGLWHLGMHPDCPADVLLDLNRVLCKQLTGSYTYPCGCSDDT